MASALLFLPLFGALGGCASAPPAGSRAALAATRDELRAFLTERAVDASEAEQFLALADSIEDRALALIDEVASFDADFDAAFRDMATAEQVLGARIDAHLDRRTRIRRSLLDEQERLKRAVGRERWPDLVEILNRGADDLVRKTRGA